MRRALAPALYGATALLVAGPLLAPGLVLAVDLALVPHPHLASDYWGVPSGTHAGSLSRLPFDLVFVLLGHVNAVAIAEKLLLLAIVFLAGWGMHRLAPVESEVARVFAGLLYAINPFVYDRLYTGQWFLLLGYALLPWAFAAFLRLVHGEWRRAWRFALLAGVTGAASPHMFALLGVLTLLTAACALGRRTERGAPARAVGLGWALALALSVYWLIPTPGLADLWQHVTAGQLDLYATVADPRWGLPAAVAGLYGYWNDAQPVKAHLASWPLVTAAIATLAAFGLTLRRRDPVAWAVGGAGLFGFLLALGSQGPTGFLFGAVLEHSSVARSFREPQKGAALLAFGYAYLGSIAVADLRRFVPAVGARRTAVALAAAFVALPVIGGYRELGGLWGSMATSSYPASWSEARSVLEHEAQGSRTLVLPWHGYMALSFAHHRVVANPAASYFDVPIVASRSVGESGAADNSDPLEASMTALLARGSRLRDLGACLAPLGVSHLLLTKDADWAAYGFLATQRDLVVERRWNDLVLYRNVHPTALAMQATSAGGNPCATRVQPLDATLLDPAHLVLDAAPKPGARVVLGSSFRPDWVFGGARSQRFAGALNAFPAATPGSAITLGAWDSYRRNYILGWLGVLIFATTAPLRRERRRRSVAPEPLAPSPRVWVILPTYNEAENVRPMVTSLLAVFVEHSVDGTVLVVDDSSPDGTGAIADELASQHPQVRVLHRGAKNGLGRAYLDGFAHALAAGAELVVQMDCDFSHDPRDVARLIEAADRADIVIGSRYVRGGGTENWGLARRVLSRGGCLYARLILGVGVRDLTGGFKCLRRDTLLRLDLQSVEANGYGFQIETTFRAHRRGLTVLEVPIVFRDRTVGTSKMSLRIAAEALLLVPRLRLPHVPRPLLAAVRRPRVS